MLLHNFVGKHDMEWVHIKAFLKKKFLSYFFGLASRGIQETLGRSTAFCSFFTFQTMKKNLSEIPYVSNASVLQRHQGCLWALSKSLENPSVCQGMNFIDIHPVQFHSLKDAVKALIWLNERPRRHCCSQPSPLASLLSCLPGSQLLGAAAFGGANPLAPRLVVLPGIVSEGSAGIPTTVPGTGSHR